MGKEVPCLFLQKLPHQGIVNEAEHCDSPQEEDRQHQRHFIKESKAE